jgi:hypothetical protein
MSKKKLSKNPRMPDPAEMAFGIMRRIAGETEPTAEPVVDEKKSKAGKIGGAKGGRARAKALSPAKRKAIAKKAAAARWG